jgi:hypothetical protein
MGNILMCGVSTRVIADEKSSPDAKWQPSAKLFTFNIVENDLQRIDCVVLPASKELNLESAPSTVWNVTVEQMIPFEIGNYTYIAVSVSITSIRHDGMPRFGQSRRFVGDICVFQVGRLQKGDPLQLLRVGEVPLINETGGQYRVSCMTLAHDRLSASPTSGEIGWLAYSSVEGGQRRGQRLGRCDIWTMRLSSSNSFELKHQRALSTAVPLHSIALLEPLSSDQLFVLGRFDFSCKQTTGNTERLRTMRANLLCWVDNVCSSPRPLSVFDYAVQCSQDKTVTFEFEDFLEQVTEQPGEHAAFLQSLKYMASCRVAIRSSKKLAHDIFNCNRGHSICEHLFNNDLAKSAPSVKSCIETFCEKLKFPFKTGIGRQKAEHKSISHLRRFYPSVENGMRKCNVVPLSGFSEFHGAWCILASTIVHLKHEIALEKLEQKKGKPSKATRDCAACQETRQSGQHCKLNEKNASEASTLRPLCLLNCHCEINCINHPTSVCSQNLLLYLVTSKGPDPDQLQGDISQNCKLHNLPSSTSLSVSSGSAVASAHNASDVSSFTSASVPIGHDASPIDDDVSPPSKDDDQVSWPSTDSSYVPDPLSHHSYIDNFSDISDPSHWSGDDDDDGDWRTVTGGDVFDLF